MHKSQNFFSLSMSVMCNISYPVVIWNLEHCHVVWTHLTLVVTCLFSAYDAVDEGTLVCSLFDSDPDIIGKIAFLLDMQKKGLKTWSDLAASLEIPRGDFKTFETCNTDCPAAERLFELVKIHYPQTTVRDLISHLEEIKRQDVIVAIRKCTEGG